MVNKPKIGREIKKPVELYHQNCVLKATVMQNRRDRLNGPQRSKAMSERKKNGRELTKKKVLEEAAKEKSLRLTMTLTSHSPRRRDQATGLLGPAGCLSWLFVMISR